MAGLCCLDLCCWRSQSTGGATSRGGLATRGRWRSLAVISRRFPWKFNGFKGESDEKSMEIYWKIQLPRDMEIEWESDSSCMGTKVLERKLKSIQNELNEN